MWDSDAGLCMCAYKLSARSKSQPDQLRSQALTIRNVSASFYLDRKTGKSIRGMPRSTVPKTPIRRNRYLCRTTMTLTTPPPWQCATRPEPWPRLPLLMVYNSPANPDCFIRSLPRAVWRRFVETNFKLSYNTIYYTYHALAISNKRWPRWPYTMHSSAATLQSS